MKSWGNQKGKLHWPEVPLLPFPLSRTHHRPIGLRFNMIRAVSPNCCAPVSRDITPVLQSNTATVHPPPPPTAPLSPFLPIDKAGDNFSNLKYSLGD